MLNRFWMKFPLMDPDPAPAGGDAPPAFDIAKAFADLTTSVNKTLNGFDAKWSKRLDKPAPAAAPEPTPEPEPQPGGAPVDPKLAAFERRAADLAKKLEAAEARTKATEEASLKRESEARNRVLSSELRTELAKYVDPAKLGAAYKMYDRDVKYNEDGQMVGPDDTPMSEYIKREMGIRENEYLLPVKQVGGAGATTGQARSAAVDLDKLKPGMDPGELAKIRAEISRVATATMAGQTIL